MIMAYCSNYESRTSGIINSILNTIKFLRKTLGDHYLSVLCFMKEHQLKEFAFVIVYYCGPLSLIDQTAYGRDIQEVRGTFAIKGKGVMLLHKCSYSTSLPLSLPEFS